MVIVMERNATHEQIANVEAELNQEDLRPTFPESGKDHYWAIGDRNGIAMESLRPGRSAEGGRNSATI